MKTFDFTIAMDGSVPSLEKAMNALFEVGADDCTPALRRGVLHISFSREKPDLGQAVGSAINHVRNAQLGREIHRVEF